MRLRRIAVWCGAILLAVAIVYVGQAKLRGASAVQWAGLFGHWGYPPIARYIVGVIELLGGIGVLIPRLRRPASLALIAVMAGALVTHLVSGELPRVIPNIVLGGLAFLLYRSSPRS